MKRRSFLVVVALSGAAVRAAYPAWQLLRAPESTVPLLDAAYYLDWARAIAEGAGRFEGAFYLAPLYPYVLGYGFRLAGEALLAVYLLQHLAVLAAAVLLGRVAERLAGHVASAATAGLVLFYHPLLFFSSRLLGESLALGLLAAAVWAAAGGEDPAGRARALGSGALAGLASLARPNLLLVPACWVLGCLIEGWRAKDRAGLRRAGLLAAATAAVIAPVTLRNFAASGHFVPISANAGLTLYHGNGPGAQGVYTPAEGFSGRVESQREEARVLASRATGRELDAVEADRWFAREALRARLADPSGTARLLVRKLLLMLSDAELSLDYPPELDESLWRWTAPVSFAWIVAFAVAGLVLAGWRGAGAWTVWGAIGACALTPLVFYVSSRYRLPLAMLLCVPAGVGVARLRESWRARAAGRRSLLAVALAAGVGLVSVAVPVGELRRSTHAVALANRASVKKSSGDLAGAEQDLRQALALDPGASAAWFNLGVVLEASGRAQEAEGAYRRVVQTEPGHAEAAGNLAGLLVRSGRATEAVPILRRALESRPHHAVCWTNLVVALASQGDLEGARQAARQAAGAGVELPLGLLEAIGMGRGGGQGEARMRGSGEER